MKDIQEAIRQAIQTEKNAMNFYELGAKEMKDKDAKRIFEQLAREEREHASHFFKAYTGDDIKSFDQFMAAPPEHESVWIKSIKKVIGPDFTEKKALEAALEKEANLEKTLTETAAKITDAKIREVFEINARETHNHYLTIESEYSRIMAMVDESDMDTFVRE
ncbi:ferritin-like domain-containing protein [Geomesophilobacter sediminis]|uniref:Ferritin family protein n=1 Tax=Geomesophilobacter sediminis TaxID=2798584 RepID=A0A8J7JDZ8_9BACT|nr:ferritin family protein [Geomesophilobacter sediminis]MBJ6725558.1 ferritin family protein [Geomesophilobacter sediminis]